MKTMSYKKTMKYDRNRILTTKGRIVAVTLKMLFSCSYN